MPARAVSVQGTLEVKRARQTQWTAAGRDERFCPGDAVRTGGSSRAAILFYPETVIRLDQYSSLVITAAETDTTPSLLELLKGAAHFISRDPRSLQIITPLANAAITGTEFLVRVDTDETGVIVYEGRVEVSNAAGSVQVGANQRAVAEAAADEKPEASEAAAVTEEPVEVEAGATARIGTAAASVGLAGSSLCNTS